MALVLNDRVKETSTTSGTGTINLAGAVTNFETFVAGIGNSNTVYYAIVHQDQPEFEVGIGTVTDASPDTLSRTTILSSSNSDSLVSFSSGTKDVFCTLPASKAVVEDASNNVTFAGTLTTGGGIDVDGSAKFDSTTAEGVQIGGDHSGTTHIGNLLNSSGVLTLQSAGSRNVLIDAGGDITLDADGGDILLKDGGTEVGRFLLDDNNHLKLKSIQSDADILFQGNDGGSGITALRLDMSASGAATFNDQVTIGGNLVHAGNMTVDVAGDLTLDAAGNQIFFKDNGTTVGTLSMTDSDLKFISNVNDKDMIFAGTDNNSEVVALTFDMSAAGKATFNSSVFIGNHLYLGDRKKAIFGAGEDLNIYHDGSNSYIQDSGTGSLIAKASTFRVTSTGDENMIQAFENGLVAIYHDSSQKFSTNSSGVEITGILDVSSKLDVAGGTEATSSDGAIRTEGGISAAKKIIAGTSITAGTFLQANGHISTGSNSGRLRAGLLNQIELSHDGTHGELDVDTGNLTLDVAGQIKLDADGGFITFEDAGTQFGYIENSSTDLVLGVNTQDKDIIFKGNDGGSTITALTLDMSAGGKAVFANNIDFGDGHFIGNDGDDNLYIASSAGEKIRLDSPDEIILDADGGNITLTDGGTAIGQFQLNDTNHLKLGSKVSDADIRFFGNDGGSTITALILDMSEAGTATFNNGVVVQGDLTVQGTTTTLNTATLDVEDKNITVNFGSGDTSGSANGAGITIQDAVNASTDATILWDATNDEFDFSHPINVTGKITGTGISQFADVNIPDNNAIRFGNSQDLQLYHDGTNSHIVNNTGILNIKNDDIRFKTSGDETSLRAVANGAVEIMHNNSTKVTTTSTGAAISGTALTAKTTSSTANDRSGAGFSLTESATDGNRRAIVYLDADNGAFSTGDSGAYAYLEKKGGGGALNIINQDTADINLMQGSNVRLKINTSGQIEGDIVNGHTTENTVANDDVIAFYDTSASAMRKTAISNLPGGGGSVAADDITTGDAAVTLGTSSGDITLDTPGDIILDADGGDIRFKDAGTEIGVIENSSSDLQIKASVQDKDIIFRGNDGGSGINALTLDMSEAGAANFNAGISIGGTEVINSSRNLTNITNLLVDNIDLGGSALTVASGDFTVDVAGNIVLNADGGGIQFYDDSDYIGSFGNSSTNFSIMSRTNDKDIVFKGIDGGSTITALTLDMSLAGTAIFNHDIEMPDAGLLRMGAGGDLILTSDGTHGTIFTNNGTLTLDSAARIDLSADDNGEVRLFDGSSMYAQFKDDSDSFVIQSLISDADMHFLGNDGGSTITALTLDMSAAGAATFNNNVTAFSDERLKDNIETLEDGLDKVEQLRGVTYTRDDRENIGVIAQEVEKILPEIVLTAHDEMGTKSVDYSRITAVLIEAVKELSARVKELESK